MAITRRTLRLSDELRVTVAAEADQVTRQLVEAWARAWDGLAWEMALAVDDLQRIGHGDGRWPSRAAINRSVRARRALAAARDELSRLADGTRVQVIDAAGRAVNLAAEAQPPIIASQMPAEAGTQATLAVTFDRVSPQAINAIVARTTRQITALSRPLSAEATNAMKRALVRGVAVGENPRVAARTMVRNLEGAFNGGLTRALTIARTEILDAHRAGAAAQQRANADTLAGWVWLAKLDKRTCPSCWSRHGQLHDLDEDGPNDHQQGRCARMPQVRTWADLGFSTPEPAPLIPDAKTVFAGLPKADKLAVMGPARLAALDDGRVGWGDLSSRFTTDGWRDSYAATPLRALALR